MASTRLLFSDELYQYILSTTTPETDIQRQLRLKTLNSVEPAIMMTTPEQVQFLKFLVRLIGAKKAIEVGVFTGYGSLAIAQALPDDGELIACDKNEAWVDIGKSYWETAGVLQKIKVKIGDAGESLQALIDQGENDFDFVFIDADKANYKKYYELCLELLSKEGLMVFDNMLALKDTFVYQQKDQASKILFEFNRQLLKDDRIIISMIPLGGGLLLVQKRNF